VRKVLLLMGLSMLGVLMFVPMAWAQEDPCPDPDFPRETPDGCQASNLPDVELGDDASASPMASPMSSPTASPTASSSATSTASASATASASSTLPDTGGPVSLIALAPLALLVGSGILAFRIVRRS